MTKVNADALLLALATLAIVVQPAHSADQKGLVLQQTGDAWGNQLVEVRPDQLRITFSRLNIILSTKKPDWHIVLANTKTRKYCELTQEEWVKLTSTHKHTNREILWMFQEKGKEKVGGMTTSHYFGQRFLRDNKTKHTVSTQAQITMLGTKPVPDAGPPGFRKDFWKKRDCWVTKELPIAPELAAIICAKGNLPGSFGIPIRIMDYQKDGRQHTVLNTVQARKVAIPTIANLRPAGYAKVKSFTALTSNATEEDPLADLMFMTEPTEQPAKLKKKL